MSRQNKLISVVVPLYKTEEQRIKSCFNSLLQQTYEKFEVLIIDDGSPDKGPLICEEYAKIDSRFKVFHKENCGVSSARNKGIEVSSGDYICFVDSDDTLEQNTFETCINVFEHYNVDVVNFGMCFEQYKNGILKHIGRKSCVENISLESSDFKVLIPQMIDTNYLVSSCNKMITSSLIKNNNIKFDTKVQKQEDFIFNMNLVIYTKKMMFIPQTFYHYYLSDGDSNSKRYEEDLFEKMIYANKRISQLKVQIFGDKLKVRAIWNRLFYNYSVCLYNTLKSEKSIREYIKEIHLIINHEEYKRVNNMALPNTPFQILISLFARINLSVGIYLLCKLKQVI